MAPGHKGYGSVNGRDGRLRKEIALGIASAPSHGTSCRSADYRRGPRESMTMTHDPQNAPAVRNRLVEFAHDRPMLEVTLGLFTNLVLVGLFAYYPAQWLGLW